MVSERERAKEEGYESPVFDVSSYSQVLKGSTMLLSNSLDRVFLEADRRKEGRKEWKTHVPIAIFCSINVCKRNSVYLYDGVSGSLRGTHGVPFGRTTSHSTAV